MNYTVLVIGYGSIGKRHADLLNSMDIISNVTVLSNKTGLPYKTIKYFHEIKKIDPSYIVIASNTSLHHEQLVYIVDNFSNKKY